MPLVVSLVAATAYAHDETPYVQQWHDAQHPSCKFVKVVAREPLPADGDATLEKWVIEACRGARYAYQVTTFEGGAMVSDFEEDAEAEVPGTEGEAQLAANAPQDVVTQVAPSSQAEFEAALEPHIAKAKASWPGVKSRYIAGLAEGEILFVTTRLSDPGNASDYEQVFVRVDAVEGETVRGRIASEIRGLQSHRAGDPIEVAEGSILDWTIARPDGSEEGNFVGKFIDTLQQ